jgi:NAD(P)-dependent dehydrogenase (short-subunit alcohol dehydrogenase family)
MGGAIALRLAEEGADIVLNDRIPGRTDEYEAKVRALGRDVVSVVASVTRREGAKQVVEAALARWGYADILVNVVGGIKGPVHNPLTDITDEQWEAAMGVNLLGTFYCTQLVVPSMIARRSGKILNIASTSWAGDTSGSAEVTHVHYTVAKAGIVAFTRSVATQLGPYNINVNAVAPGGTRTLPDERMPQRASEDRTADNPLGRMNEPEDIANAVLFLVSEEARNISGQLLTVAGGLNPSL